MEFCNELPDALIVGVGDPVTGTLKEMLHATMHLRMRDFVNGLRMTHETVTTTHGAMVPFADQSGLQQVFSGCT